ncbi:MAG: hypothetical protein ACI9P7_000055 [Candidatus Azotimanducaceae bacterium]|jgi:hypothetical protein
MLLFGAVAQMPRWYKKSILIFRAILSIGLLVALLFEVKLPVGRLNSVCDLRSCEVFATIGHTVGPNQGPTPQRICFEAESVADAAGKVVKFMAHPWFEVDEK